MHCCGILIGMRLYKGTNLETFTNVKKVSSLSPVIPTRIVWRTPSFMSKEKGKREREREGKKHLEIYAHQIPGVKINITCVPFFDVAVY